MALQHYVGLWSALSQEEREAYFDLAVARFLELSYPSREVFGRFYGEESGSPGFEEKWAEVLAHARQINVDNVIEHAVISLVTARDRNGRPVALAAQQIIRGEGDAPLDSAVGEAKSTLPSHRMLRRFSYPRTSWLDPARTTESQIAEFVRLVVAGRDTVLPLVAARSISSDEAHAVLSHGMQAVVATAFRRDQALAPAPIAYITNTRARLVRVVARLGLDWLPLFVGGVEPAPHLLNPQGFNYPFWNWAPILRPHVPATVLDAGVAAAVAYLAQYLPEVLAKLPLSMPYMLPSSAETRATLADWTALYRLADEEGPITDAA